MSQDTLSEDIALRIGLAARALPETDAARLLRVLADAVGLPPTAAKLDGLTVKSLRNAADGELVEIEKESLKQALALLKGEGADTIEPPPPLEPYAEGDLPGSIRVACASNGGELLDGHFGSCRRFLIYQVSASDHRLIDCRDIDDAAPAAKEDKNGHRADLIEDCQVLLVASIGGPAAARVVRRDIHPIKHPQMGDAREQIRALQRSLADKAPPWLAKVMGQDREDRVRFERSAEDA
jgi:nitrogen fixation protein NifX